MDGSGTSTYRWAPVIQAKGQARKDIDYILKFRQQPRQARMCGVGDKADRRPIDPPPVVQLTVIDKAALASSNRANQQLSARDKAAANSRSKAKENAEDHPAGQTYLQNPYYLMNATLTRADDQSDLHLLKDGKTRYTLGSTVSSLFQLKDEDKSDAGFFVFPDLSVRVEGDYRLKLDLYEIVADELHYCKTILSDPFQVYTAKRFPGNQQSTNMTKLLSSQGIKVRTHHAAAPSRPASGRRLSTSSSKRKVDLGSSAMVKTESSSSSCEMADTPSISLERRDSTTSSKRPRTAGLDAGGGRPSSRPGSMHSAHEHDPHRPISWGPPPHTPSSAAAAAGYPSGVIQPSTASYGYHSGPSHPYPTSGPILAGDATRAYRDPREPWPQEAARQPSLGRTLDPRAAMEDAWRLGGGGANQQPPAVDLSRSTLPPMSSIRGASNSNTAVEGQYHRPPSSNGSTGGFHASSAYGEARHPSFGGPSESSAHRSSMSSVISDRYSISSERPSGRHASLSSGPSSYGPSPSDADRQGPTRLPFDQAGRYSAGSSIGLPSFQSLHDDSKRQATSHLVSFPSEGAHGTSFGVAGGGGGPPVLPALSTPRLPSLSEMMAQPSVRVTTPQRSLSPLGEASRSAAAAGPHQTSPGRASSSRGGRMGLSNLLAD